MTKRIVSLLLALVLLIGVTPVTSVSAAEQDYGTYGGVSAPAGPNGGTVSPNGPSAASDIDTTVDYCSILGITKKTAEKFGSIVRESLRRYDFDISLSGVKIPVDVKNAREWNAFRAMMEHEVYYYYDTFMCDFANYQYWYDNGYMTRLKFKEEKINFTYSEYQSYMTSSLMVAEYLMDGIKGNQNLTDLEKALLLHDRLAAWSQYDYDNTKNNTCPPESYTIAGVLWKQEGVCQGYSEAYAYMLDQCGIENRFAQSSDLNHIWNIVTIDGREYYVDVTWDDPATYDRYGQVKHDYFLISLSKLRKDHNTNDYCTIPQYDKYDSHFWTNSHSEFQLIDDEIYFLNNKVASNARYAALYRWIDENNWELRLDFNEDEVMKWYGSNGYYWTDRNYATMAEYDGKLYVSSAKKVYEYDPVNRTWRVVFIPQLSGYDCIYGFTMFDHRMMMNFYDSAPQSQTEHTGTKKYFDLKTVSGIEVERLPNKEYYVVGDEYDWRGITLKVTFADGTSGLVKNRLHSWNGWNTATTGAKDFRISYYGHNSNFTVQVIDPLTTPKVTVKNTDKGVAVSWNKVKNAGEYIVYRSYKSGGKWSDWSKMKLTTGTSWTDKSAKAGKVYRYAVYAYCDDIRSNLGKSSELRRLTTPTSVKVANSASGCYITWKKVTGATKYAVYRNKAGSSTWTKIKETTALKYTDTKAAGNATYRYAVRALNGSQKSENGITAYIKRLAASTVTAKKSGSTIKLSWTKVTGAQHYAVYRRKAGSSTWTKIYTTKTRAYTDKSAKKGVYYEYSVRAVNGKYASAYKACKKVKR